MEYRQLGNSGLKVSSLALGTMTFGGKGNFLAVGDTQVDEARRIVDMALDAGVNVVDTADVYSEGRSEEIVGEILKGRRDKVVLATKARFPMGDGPNDAGLSRGYLMRATEASLRRLNTDYIDLYQVHWPDPATPIEETLQALDTLVQCGKVRYVGCSNFPAWQLADALWTSASHNLARFECDQPRYNLLFRMIEDEIVPLCQAHGVGIIAYNPLAGGMLTGRYRGRHDVEEGTRFALAHAGDLYRKRYWHEEVLETVDRLAAFFEQRGKKLLHVALSWVLAQPGITSAIVGASRPDQLAESLLYASVALDDEERVACDGAWYSLPRERDRQVALR